MQLDSNIRKLVDARDPSLNKRLFLFLNDKRKTLAIHAILTKRIDSNAKLESEYIYKEHTVPPKVIRINFIWNHFHWYFLSNSYYGKYNIDDDEIDKIKQYWAKRLQ
jgi:hypothetical protein